MKRKSLSILVTHMGSNVSGLVELISRHTTLKLAGIDQPPAATPDSLAFYGQLKRDADLLIVSAQHLLEWHSLSSILNDAAEDTANDVDAEMFVIFDHVTAAFHMRDTYERLVDELLLNQRRRRRVLGLGTLDIDSSVDDARSIRAHIDTLKRLFRCERVETATDLLDTFNIFNGFEPVECVDVCDEAVGILTTHEFNIQLVNKIKCAFLFFEQLVAASNTGRTLVLLLLLLLSSNNHLQVFHVTLCRDQTWIFVERLC